jgi:hypothetical protein
MKVSSEEPPSTNDPPPTPKQKITRANALLIAGLSMALAAYNNAEKWEEDFHLLVTSFAAGVSTLAAPAPKLSDAPVDFHFSNTDYGRGSAITTDPYRMKDTRQQTRGEKNAAARTAKKAAKAAEIEKVGAPAIGISACWAAIWAYFTVQRRH